MTTTLTGKPKRVCIFPDRIDDGGIDRYALNLAEILLQKGVAVDLFVTSGEGKLLRQVRAAC